MSEPLSFKDKLLVIGFMGFAFVMLAIGGLLDLFEVPFDGDENDDQQNT